MTGRISIPTPGHPVFAIAVGLVLATAWPPVASAQSILAQERRFGPAFGDTFDGFGSAVATAGDVLVVGTPGDDDAGRDSGSAFVYRRQGAQWLPEAKLVASDAEDGDEFGMAVATTGDRIFVGAPHGISAGGAVYVFTRGSQGWVEEAVLVPADLQQTTPAYGNWAGFGAALAVQGDRLVIGAPRHDQGVLVGSIVWASWDEGAVYVFERGPAGWQEQARLRSAGAGTGDRFGASVALDGDRLVAGADHFASPNSNGPGHAALFVRQPDGSWSEEARLEATDGFAGDRFGLGVALRGSMAVVGSPRWTDGSEPGLGAVYVFERIGAQWSQTRRLLAADRQGTDLFGWSVALSDDALLVGAMGDDGAAYLGGSLYVFDPADGSQIQEIHASDTTQEDRLGWSIAVAGDVAVAGAPYGDAAAPYAGAAYVLERGGGSWSESAILSPAGGAGGELFGRSVALDGDRAAVGSPFDDQGVPSTGAVYLLERPRWQHRARLSASDGETGDTLGFSVALAGDRLLAGAPGDDDGGDEAGAAWFFAPDAGGVWREQQKLAASDAGAGDRFGEAVATDGDRAAVGAPGDAASAGSVYLFGWSGAGWSEEARLAPVDLAAGDGFGGAVSVSGDRVAVGAPQHGAGGVGAVWVYRADPGGWTFESKLLASDAAPGARFAAALVLDGDRLAVGAPEHDGGEGAVYIFEHDGQGWVERQRLAAAGGAAGDRLGAALDLEGDWLAAGVPADGPGGSGPGGLVLFERGPGGWTEIDRLAPSDGQAGDRFGAAVATSRTLFVLAGAPEHLSLGVDSGAVYLYEPADQDGDGYVDPLDNCPTVHNPNQTDSNGNGVGDECDSGQDFDGDGISNDVDNCPWLANANQADWNGDGQGDVCDHSDGDGIADADDNCRTVSNPDQADRNANGVGDACDDPDADGIIDWYDNCPDLANASQADEDRDGLGDACDAVSGIGCQDGVDNDGDGLVDSADPSCIRPDLLREDAWITRVASTRDFDDANKGDGVCAAFDGSCTLRAALAEADGSNRPGSDVLVLPPGVYAIEIPGAGEDSGRTGDFDPRGQIAIVGTGARSGDTVIDGAGLDRVFEVWSTVWTLQLSNLTVRGGSGTTLGGAVRNHGTFIATDCTFEANTAPFGGGALLNEPAGVPPNESGGTMLLDSCTISGNTTAGSGGGLYVAGGDVELRNVTFSGNTAAEGGAIWNAGRLDVRSSTIAENDANTTGGLYSEDSGSAVVRNTILAGNTAVGAPSDCADAWAESGVPRVTSGGYNLVGVVDPLEGCPGLEGTTDQAGSEASPLDARLGPLLYHGGATLVHAPWSTSPAIDAGSPEPAGGASSCEPRDQRGVGRPADGNQDGSAVCDIGTVEADSIGCDDPARTIDALLVGSSGCALFDADPGACAAAWERVDGEAAACFHDAVTGCRACDEASASAGACVNACTAPCDDPLRVLDAGTGPDACWALDGDPAACALAFTTLAGGEVVSCFVEAGTDFCLPCDEPALRQGDCQNSCAPPVCIGPGRADNLGFAGCGALDGDPAACQAAFSFELAAPGEPPTSCYYVAATGWCDPCDPGYEQADGRCLDECRTLPCEDATRTLNAGSVGVVGCESHDGVLTAGDCSAAFEIDEDGDLRSCWWEPLQQRCLGCTPEDELAGRCESTCRTPLCGDGRISVGETCDDGDRAAGNGCDALCRQEPGFDCRGAPSRCGRIRSQSTSQQTCIRTMSKQGSKLALLQGRDALTCLKAASVGQTTKLARSGQTATAQACLTNDVRGKLARHAQKLVDLHASKCLAAPEMPDWAYSGMALLSQAPDASLGIVNDVFGGDLDRSVVSRVADPKGLRCQMDVAKGFLKLFDILWKEAGIATTNALSGRGGSPIAGSAAAFEQALVAHLEGDAKGRIATMRARLEQKAAICDQALTPLAQLFRGRCFNAADTTAFVDCIARRTRCRFCQSLNDFDDLLVDCDLFDEGSANDSCD